MLGLRLADFIFRGLMGAIVIGWIAFMISVQSEYRATQKAAESASPVQGSTFVEESYDRSMGGADPYATANDEVLRETMIRERMQNDDYVADDVVVDEGGWGN